MSNLRRVSAPGSFAPTTSRRGYGSSRGEVRGRGLLPRTVTTRSSRGRPPVQYDLTRNPGESVARRAEPNNKRVNLVNKAPQHSGLQVQNVQQQLLERRVDVQGGVIEAQLLQDPGNREEPGGENIFNRAEDGQVPDNQEEIGHEVGANIVQQNEIQPYGDPNVNGAQHVENADGQVPLNQNNDVEARVAGVLRQGEEPVFANREEPVGENVVNGAEDDQVRVDQELGREGRANRAQQDQIDEQEQDMQPIGEPGDNRDNQVLQNQNKVVGAQVAGVNRQSDQTMRQGAHGHVSLNIGGIPFAMLDPQNFMNNQLGSRLGFNPWAAGPGLYRGLRRRQVYYDDDDYDDAEEYEGYQNQHWSIPEHFNAPPPPQSFHAPPPPPPPPQVSQVFAPTPQMQTLQAQPSAIIQDSSQAQRNLPVLNQAAMQLKNVDIRAPPSGHFAAPPLPQSFQQNVPALNEAAMQLENIENQRSSNYMQHTQVQSGEQAASYQISKLSRSDEYYGQQNPLYRVATSNVVDNHHTLRQKESRDEYEYNTKRQLNMFKGKGNHRGKAKGLNHFIEKKIKKEVSKRVDQILHGKQATSTNQYSPLLPQPAPYYSPYPYAPPPQPYVPPPPRQPYAPPPPAPQSYWPNNNSYLNANGYPDNSHAY